MLIKGILCCRNYQNNLYLFRFSKHFVCEYSTSRIKKDNPVQYSITKASKISISENLKIYEKPNPNKLWYRRYVYIGCLASILVYFCILREENDIDEILKGNEVFQSDQAKLVDLQLKLVYCERNNLPTVNLKNKIEELREKIIKDKNKDNKIKYM